MAVPPWWSGVTVAVRHEGTSSGWEAETVQWTRGVKGDPGAAPLGLTPDQHKANQLLMYLSPATCASCRVQNLTGV
jgi:hypothetical protein